MLRIGQIDYANCVPIFTMLRERFDCAGYRFVTGIPSELNAMLSRGEIDVSPSSSIEYGKASDRYMLLPDLSISSVGPVKSVFLFSRVPIEELSGARIALTTESDTSVNLLRIILARRYGFINSFVRCPAPLLDALRDFPAMLQIGDAALRSASQPTDLHVYDLGELWHDFTGLPFVFALWIIRRDAVQSSRSEVRRLLADLLAAKELARANYDTLSLESPSCPWMPRSELAAYWHNISYDLTPNHIAGLRLYFRHAAELGILEREPEISLFTP
ncbi:MAG: menaquinone biosynthesis protein [Geobacter sp.]|nr:menaquinone biosynthesis protein [Geobacter sp.]